MDSKQTQSNDPEARFSEAVGIMARLRAPGGCPWDREQDFNSIRKYTLEETYEVLDAIERQDWPHLKDELGDLLLQVLFYAQMASEASHFTITDVIDGLNRKLIRRHPHVFGDAASAAAGNVAPSLKIEGIDSAQVLRNWDEIKAAEKQVGKTQPVSRLDSVPRSLPAVLEAAKLGSRAAKCGFDWPEIEGLFTKLAEETSELKEAMASENAEKQREIESEVGDLLFTMVNLARRLNVDPEMALRGTNAKFRSRFQSMESESDEPLELLSLEKLDELWTSAKKGDRR